MQHVVTLFTAATKKNTLQVVGRIYDRLAVTYLPWLGLQKSIEIVHHFTIVASHFVWFVKKRNRDKKKQDMTELRWQKLINSSKMQWSHFEDECLIKNFDNAFWKVEKHRKSSRALLWRGWERGTLHKCHCVKPKGKDPILYLIYSSMGWISLNLQWSKEK